MLISVRSAQFKRDVRRTEKRGKDLTKLRVLLAALIQKEPLSARYLDHPLRGIWKGYREAHIEPDWLLIYRIEGDEWHLVRTGSHSDLFKEQVGSRAPSHPFRQMQARIVRSSGLVALDVYLSH